MPKTLPPPPPWISGLHAGIIVLCVAVVLVAATFQHLFVIGYAPQGRFYIVPSIVGTFFGVMLVTVRRVVVVNRSYAAALAERNERIETMNRELEARVEARTEELSAKHLQLLQAQRLEMVGQLVGGVAHDLNNLLMVIRGNVDLLQGAEGDAPLIRDIVNATEKGERLIKGLLETSMRSRAPKHAPIDSLVDELTGLLQRAFGRNYSIDVTHEPGAAPLVDAGRLEQVLLNLLVNARDAQPGGGRILVRTANGASGRAILEVEDEGPGVAPEVAPHIFETFFTTKPEGKGSGLGLSTVRMLVDEVGGSVTLRRGPGGACFRVELPAAATVP